MERLPSTSGTARTKLAFRPPARRTARADALRRGPPLRSLPTTCRPATGRRSGATTPRTCCPRIPPVCSSRSRATCPPEGARQRPQRGPTALLACLLADLRERAGQQVAHLGGAPARARRARRPQRCLGPTRRGCSGRRRWRPALRRRRLSPNARQPRGPGWPNRRGGG